jgi:hypothetical protein
MSTQPRTYPVIYGGWIGAVLSILVLLLAILGLLHVVPLTETVVFGMFAALAVARLI